MTSAEKLAENEAIRNAQAGDEAAFEFLYKKHKSRVYSICLRMTHNVADAEDMTQNTFLQLHRKIATFRGESAFSTWLHRMAVNIVLMNLRKRELDTVSVDDQSEDDDEPKWELQCNDSRLLTTVERTALERVLEILPDGYRIIFVLHDIRGFEHQEIAKILECSIGNSKSQLHKARLAIFNELNPSGDVRAFKKFLREFDTVPQAQTEPIV